MDERSSLSSDFSDEDIIIALAESSISGGNLVMPTGFHKNFKMIALWKRFTHRTNRMIPTKILWEVLHHLYNLSGLEQQDCPSPNEPGEFCLPEEDFGKLMRDRGDPSLSQGKTSEDESRGGDDQVSFSAGRAG